MDGDRVKTVAWVRTLHGERRDDAAIVLQDGPPCIVMVRGIEPGLVIAGVAAGAVITARAYSTPDRMGDRDPWAVPHKVVDIGDDTRIVEVEMIPNSSGEDRVVLCIQGIEGV